MRSIRESPRYQDQVDGLGVSVQRLDEVLQDGVLWAAANDAEAFAKVPGTDLRCILTDPFPGIPALRIFFRLDELYVDLEWIEEVPSDLDEPVD